MGGKCQREFPADPGASAGHHNHLILHEPDHKTSTPIFD
jgi:hypothetical protein